MINFRYHIVSLMAVFLALAVGIVLGVTLLSDPANETIVNQAQQDRRELQQTREQLTRQNTLNTYRDAWAERVGPQLTRDGLVGEKVALVVMPDAPARVVRSISDAVGDAGGTVVSTTEVNRTVYDVDSAEEVAKVVNPLTANDPDVTADSTTSTRFGLALAQGLLSDTGAAPSAVSERTLTQLLDARLVTVDVDAGVDSRADAVVVVTAAAPDSSDTTAGSQTQNHAQTELALKSSGISVVVAGPNSDTVSGSDVQQIRNPGASADDLSTVDVADLPSGVITTVLALQEQRAGGQGHYGATGDAVAPELPIR